MRNNRILEKKRKTNPLKQAAKKHRKHNKGLSPYSYLNPNAGDVEAGISFFNNAMGSGECNASSGTGIGESMRNKINVKEDLNTDSDVINTFNEMLDLYEFQLVHYTQDNTWGLYDLQGANLGDIESDRFDDITDILERLEIYHDDYIVEDLEEIFEDELGDFTYNNYEELLNELKRIIKEIDLKDGSDYSQFDLDCLELIINAPSIPICNKSLDEIKDQLNYEEDNETISEKITEENMSKKINIKESLLDIDRDTCNTDFVGMYEACRLTNEDKRELVELLQKRNNNLIEKFLYRKMKNS